jgi:hypothetical protein
LARRVALAYLSVANTLAMLRLLPRSDRDKDAEILALRHQIRVLERIWNQLGLNGEIFSDLGFQNTWEVTRGSVAPTASRSTSPGAPVSAPGRLAPSPNGSSISAPLSRSSPL